MPGKLSESISDALNRLATLEREREREVERESENIPRSRERERDDLTEGGGETI